MEDRKYATIIGSRNATEEELKKLRNVAEKLHSEGFILRSGGAEGCDAVINDFLNVEIIIPWNGFNNLLHDGKRIFELSKLPDNKKSRETIQKIHPAFDKLSQGALKLHQRNIYQITGVKGVNRNHLSSVVHFVADEKNKKVSGGTSTAVNLARKLNIKTINHRI